mmetsp:Transcript_27168/g.38932  ORF Transcript_27168/g.38932 Transcript_27168/m.38932 type:complete len:852 (-) Transcript_27168:123-2678(-)|eukprot:CAMPEP_0172416634 /NCGR_PEP_ID=MMETSP1064-20121228/3158_1 /TAXON_ID=202472 /ORGANISM="Aulacoseira subarctica , Strain CCAP 1002/5" /LENGTH=851 /DNA_ID=CAMNT_0013154467 /DNA_START=13 /DNA_END=2568 /DNA_ORIENTATION=-
MTHRVSPSSDGYTNHDDDVVNVIAHRIRYLNCIPKSIICMRHIPCENNEDEKTKQKKNLIAISRKGGSVEIINASEKFRTISNIPGMPTREVTCITFLVRDNICVGGSNTDGTLFVIHFPTQTHKSVINLGGGAVLSLEAIVFNGADEQQFLAVGCEDGFIRIVSYNNDDRKFELVSTLVANASVLSLAWWDNSNSNDLLGGCIYAGCADGTIRKFDCSFSTTSSNKSKKVLSFKSSAAMRMTAETQGSTTTPTKIWTCACLKNKEDKDHQLVTGNSLGQVQFWDCTTGTLLQTFDQNENQASVLTLVANSTHSKVFASGVDPRVACLSRASSSTWIATEAYRPHTHQINSLIIMPGSSSEILVSGGMDTKLCTYLATPTATSIFNSNTTRPSNRPRHIRLWPSSSEGNHPIHLATRTCDHSGVIGVMRHDAVDLYLLSKTIQQDCSSDERSSGNNDYSRAVSPQLLVKLKVESRYNLSCMALCSSKDLLAINDASETRIYQFIYDSDGKVVETKRIPLESHSFSSKMCSCMLFFGDYLFCALTEGPIVVYSTAHLDMSDSLLTITLIHVFTEHIPKEMDEDEEERGQLKVAAKENYPFTRLDVSSDGQYLVAGSNICGLGAVHVFSLVTAVDTTKQSGRFSHWWCVPILADIPSHTALKFAGDVELIIACVDNTFYILDVEAKSTSQWSLDMGIPPKLPEELIVFRRDFPISIAMNPVAATSQFFLGGHGFFCAIDIDKAVPKRVQYFPDKSPRAFVKRQPQNSSSTITATDDENQEALLAPEEVTTKKRKKMKAFSSSGTNKNYTICVKYDSVLHLEFFKENELVIVEQPWLTVVNSLPDPLERRIYGS